MAIQVVQKRARWPLNVKIIVTKWPKFLKSLNTPSISMESQNLFLWEKPKKTSRQVSTHWGRGGIGYRMFHSHCSVSARNRPWIFKQKANVKLKYSKKLEGDHHQLLKPKLCLLFLLWNLTIQDFSQKSPLGGFRWQLIVKGGYIWR